MYTGKHPIYQTLLVNDMTVRVNAPQEVKDYIAKNESFSRSGDSCRGEGAEAENRSLKSNLPPGVPTIENWVVASRCDRQLKMLRSQVFSCAKLKDPGDERSSIFKFDEEIQMFRNRIRMSGMLASPMKETPLRSITGTRLHPELVNFYFTARDSYRAYKNGKESADPVPPIFILPEEETMYNNVQNWTVKKIDAEIFKLVDCFDEDEAGSYRTLFECTVAGEKKEKHISFYMDVKSDTAEEDRDIMGMESSV
jgi:hypothetical protein